MPSRLLTVGPKYLRQDYDWFVMINLQILVNKCWSTSFFDIDSLNRQCWACYTFLQSLTLSMPIAWHVIKLGLLGLQLASLARRSHDIFDGISTNALSTICGLSQISRAARMIPFLTTYPNDLVPRNLRLAWPASSRHLCLNSHELKSGLTWKRRSRDSTVTCEVVRRLCCKLCINPCHRDLIGLPQGAILLWTLMLVSYIELVLVWGPVMFVRRFQTRTD